VNLRARLKRLERQLHDAGAPGTQPQVWDWFCGGYVPLDQLESRTRQRMEALSVPPPDEDPVEKRIAELVRRE